VITNIGDKKLLIPRAKAGAFRRALELTQDKDLSKMNSKDLDEMVEFCCQALDYKLTVDEFYNEVFADELVEKINEIMGVIIGATSDKMGEAGKNK